MSTELVMRRKTEIFEEQGKTILLIEDDHDIRDALQSALESEGFEVFTAENGREALDLLPSIPKPSLILLDLMMPEMDGWQFRQKLNEDQMLSSIPIVVITALGEQAGDIECEEIIGKPFQLESVLEKVRHYFLQGFFGEAKNRPINNKAS